MRVFASKLLRWYAPARSRGQSLVIVATALLVLLAFIGLTVDGGILFVTQAHLRRATDAAALAATSQMREGARPQDVEQFAKEFIEMNGVSAATVTLSMYNYNNGGTPDAGTGLDDPDCFTTLIDKYGLCGKPLRKFVRVEASTPARFAFMPIFGITSANVVASSQAEAASLDVVLVIDISQSMASASGGIGSCNNSVYTDTVSHGDCLPFEDVRAAAKAFAAQMYTPFDRVSVVTFARKVELATVFYTQTADMIAGLNSLKITSIGNEANDPCPGKPYDYVSPPGVGCSTATTLPNDKLSINTNTGAGLDMAARKFGDRKEAVWVVILLSDGSVNASTPDATHPYGYCPEHTWTDGAKPYCRDEDATSPYTTTLYPTCEAIYLHPEARPISVTRHSITTTTLSSWGITSNPAEYDSEDWARDKADALGCPPFDLPGASAFPFCSSRMHGSGWAGGAGATIYAIGLGREALLEQDRLHCPYSLGGNPAWLGITDAGERFLRYVAWAGSRQFSSDYTTVSADPCATAPIGTSCGNYYFAAGGSELTPIFEDIAKKLFTRITK